MPGTPEELVALAAAWPDDSLIPPVGHRWADGTAISPDEETDLLALRSYAQRMRSRHRWAASQRKAYRLLRSLLSHDQRRQLARLGHFYVTTPSGAAYRLDPRRGMAERVEWHRSRYFAVRSYCLHDDHDADKMPPADVTIAHLLLLLADEPAFLATANATRRDDQLWNRGYLRRMRNRHVDGQPSEAVA